MTDSKTLRSIAGDATLASVDAAQDSLAATVLRICGELREWGYLDAPDAVIGTLAQRIAADSRNALKRLVFDAYSAGRNYGCAPQDDIPTRPNFQYRVTAEWERVKK